MDTSALLGSGLQAGMGLFQGMSQGSAKGMGGGIGSTVGGLAGSMFGGPLGSMIGSAAGGLLGGGLETLIGGGGGKKKKKKTAARRALSAAAKPAAVAKVAQKVAARSSAAPGVVASQMQHAGAAVQAAKIARTETSNKLGRAIMAAPGGYEALAVAAGVRPEVARAGNLSPGLLVRTAGLDRIGKIAGLGGAAGVARATGLAPAVLRATGLHLGQAQHRRLAGLIPQAAATLVSRSPARSHHSYELTLEGLSDGPPKPPGIPGVPFNSVQGDIPKPKTPGAVPVRAGQWDLDAGTYVLAWGDTLTGLAITYLGQGGKWREIWDAQPASFRQSHAPSVMQVGETLVMPAAAVDNARVLLGKPGSKVGPNGKPVDPKGSVLPTGGGWSTGAKVVAGAAGAAALLGVGYALTH